MTKPGYSIDPPPEPTGIAAFDEAERAARSRLIELLDAGRDPQDDEEYLRLSDRVTELMRRHGLEDAR